MQAHRHVWILALWTVGCAAQATAGGDDPTQDESPALSPGAPWGAAGALAEEPLAPEATPPEGEADPNAPAGQTGTSEPTSAQSSGANAAPQEAPAAEEEPSTSTPSSPSSPSTSTTPATTPGPPAAPPPIFPPPDPDRTPSVDNIAECPDVAPADPWGPCIGVPVYATCKYGTTYSCLCDWIHWICVG